MVAFVTEAAVASISAMLDVNAAVAASYIVAAGGEVATAPVLRVLSDRAGAGNFKFAAYQGLVGGKLGTYWPGNAGMGLENHAATTLLLDPETGYLNAILSARLLNRLRTAAGNAVAVQALARDDAAMLALIGGGGQAPFEAEAIARIRDIRTIMVGLRNPSSGAAMIERLGHLGVETVVCGIEEAVRAADIVVTATSAREPLVRADWVRPGTHISAMGADAVGKQELDPELFGKARLFADLESQSRTIGEFQHLAEGINITQLGDVLAGKGAGRSSPTEITIFDSSGLAIQDLFVAQAALDLARQNGLLVEMHE